MWVEIIVGRLGGLGGGCKWAGIFVGRLGRLLASWSWVVSGLR